MYFLVLMVHIMATYQWQVVYQAFMENSFTGVDGWSDGEGELVYTMDCSKNGLRMVRLDGLYDYAIKTITGIPPHYQIELVIDIYMGGSVDSGQNEKTEVQFNGVLVFTRGLTLASPTFPDYKNVCWDSGSMSFDTSRTTSQHQSSSATIEVQTNLNEDWTNEYALFRNVQVSILPCHITCLTCDGPNYNQCLSCFSDDTPVSGECQCEELFQPNGGCVSYCFIGYWQYNRKICQVEPSKQIQYIGINLVSFDIVTPFTDNQGWLSYPDNLPIGTEECIPDTILGLFQFQEGIQKQIQLTALDQYLQLTFVIYFYSTWSADEFIQVNIGHLILITIHQTDVVDTQNNVLLDPDASSWTTCAEVNNRIKYGLTTYLYGITDPTIIIKGYLNTSTSKWGIMNIRITRMVCAVNCQECLNGQKCRICQASYLLYQGKCILTCPLDSIQDGIKCIGFDEVAKFSKYIDKAFFDFSTSAEQADNFFILQTQSGVNFAKGVKFSYFPTKRVFGGVLTWIVATLYKEYSIPKPHYAIKVMMTIIFGDDFQMHQYFSSQFGDFNGQIYKSSNSWPNVVGDSGGEYFHNAQMIVNYQDSLFKIVVQCNGVGQAINTAFCAIADYVIVVLYCDDFCPRCNNDYECIQCDSNLRCSTCFGVSNDQCLSCYPQQYRILSDNQCVCQEYYYEDHGYDDCRPCFPLCKQCIGQFDWQCTECTNSLTVVQVNQVCSCINDELFINEFHDCEQCHPYCLRCTYGYYNTCISCDPLLNRELNQSNCNCMFGYFQDGNQSVCSKCNQQQINNPECYANCGDSIVQWNEQCDDGNYLPWDGCNQCQFQCSQLCLTCINGKCDQCIEGYVLNGLIGCVAVCGDKLIFELEQCDDGNQFEYDGCHNCINQCQLSCIYCVQGTCWQCQLGYQLIDGFCAKCGDGQFNQYTEQCDDGNLTISDGCTNCIIDKHYFCLSEVLYTSKCYFCRLPCTQCIFGLNQITICIKCAVGYVLIQGVCVKCSLKCIDCIDNPNKCVNCLYPQLNCKLCESQIGLNSNIIEASCYSICGDGELSIYEECDDHNTQSGDGCSSDCKNEPGWAYKLINSQIIFDPIELTTTIIEQPIIYSAQIQKILISFSRQVRFVDANNKNTILSHLDAIDAKDYEINLIEVNEQSTYLQDVRYELTIQSYRQLTSPNLILIVTDNIIDDYDRLVVQPKGFQVLNLYYISDIEQQAIKETVNVNAILIYIIASTSSIQFLQGNIQALVTMLDLLQYLSYLKYINLCFPISLEIYFQVFDMISIDPLLNTLGVIGWIELPQINTKHRFEYFDVNALFTVNFLSVVFVIISSYIGYIISYMIIMILQQEGLNKYIGIKVQIMLLRMSFRLQSFTKSFHYSGLLQLIISCNYDLIFASVLQLMYYTTINDNIALANLLGAGLACLGQVSLIIYLISNLFIPIKLMGSTIKFQTQDNNSDFWSRQHISILLIKNFAFLTALVVLQGNPAIQILLILSVQFLFSLYFWKVSPFKNRLDNIQAKVTETCVFITTSTFIVYLFEEQYISYSTKTYMALCQLSLLSFIILFSAFSNCFVSFRQFYKALLKLYNQSKRRNEPPKKQFTEFVN